MSPSPTFIYPILEKRSSTSISSAASSNAIVGRMLWRRLSQRTEERDTTDTYVIVPSNNLGFPPASDTSGSPSREWPKSCPPFSSAAVLPVSQDPSPGEISVPGARPVSDISMHSPSPPIQEDVEILRRTYSEGYRSTHRPGHGIHRYLPGCTQSLLYLPDWEEDGSDWRVPSSRCEGGDRP